MRFIFLSFVFLFAAQALGHDPKEGDIRASVGPYWYRTDRRDHEFTPETQGGFGITVEGDVDNNGGIEVGVFYMRQFFSIQKDGRKLSEFGRRMYITMGYRHWFSREFSSALGFFSSYSMGDSEIVSSDFPQNAQPKTSASDVTEYGFDFSLQWEPLYRDRLALVFDARYSLSVTPKPGEAANFFGILVAFKYYIQGKDAAAD